MLRHNLLLIYRNFLRFKSTFLINLIGLSSGLTCALLIYLWINDELHVNKFNEKDEQLFQVLQNVPDHDGTETGEFTQGLLATALASELPEVEYAASTVPASWFPNTAVVAFNGTRIRAKGQFVSKDYFSIFTCPIIAGSKKDILPDKHSMAISDELARKLFKSPENAVGKTIQWNQHKFIGSYHVTSVFKKLPANATTQYDLLVNYELFFEQRPGLRSWGNSDPHTFVLLKKGTDPTLFNHKIKNFIQTKDSDSKSTLFVQRYSEKYLHGRYENGSPVGGRIEYVRLFSIIAVFILVIACINFMNLSTAKASRRLKEVGIKKAIGAGRKSLILQYLGESLLMSFISLMVSILLVDLLLPSFNVVTGKNIQLYFSPLMLSGLVGITAFTGILSGSYPALFLSGFSPAAVLKGKLHTSLGEVLVRKGLVIFQFTVSVILIVSVLVVYKQISYIQTKNLGYNRDNILLFDMEIDMNADEQYFNPGGKHEKNVQAFINEVKEIPGVINAANFYHDLTGQHGDLGGVDWEDGEQDEAMGFSNLEVGYDFIETLGIQMVAGRSFSKDLSNERTKIIFNEAAIKQMGLKDPIGKTIKLWGREKQIIGIAKNFHFESLYEEVKPCLLQCDPRTYKIMVKIKGGSERKTIAQLQHLFERHSPGLALDYHFLDDDYEALYTSEQNVSLLSRCFAVIAILISCLGLFGLVAFSAERRMKEIGIRKILGSTSMGIVYLLSGDFTKMVLIAIFLALPISYFMTKNWLDNFAYKTPLELWYFIGAGLSALFIAWITIGMQTIKASRINPTQCLRDE
jgi:putative ABC transport system permease protein